MPLLDLQRRGQQIGRLRIGEQVKTGKRDKNGSEITRPSKLATFRFTTQSRHGADAIAALFGGEVTEWNGEWEVVTGQSEIGVTVPPRDQVVSQWYEMWSRGGCQRRCDSVTEQLTGGPCLCPRAADPDDERQAEAAAIDRARLAALNPPQACKRVTRISVMIPDLPGLGVFRLDTGSYYAAAEIGDAAAIMQMARDKGVFLPAILRIEQRSRVAGGQTKRFPVPVLEITTTFRQIASGALEAAGIAAQLPPAPGDAPRALTAAPAPEPDASLPVAQQIASRARAATTSTEMRRCFADAASAGAEQDHVWTDDEGIVFEELLEYLRARWRELAAEQHAGQS
jgi:hypothetical protein